MDHLLWYWSRLQQACAIDVYLRQKIKSSQKSNLAARISWLAFYTTGKKRGCPDRNSTITWCHGGTPRTVKWGACRDSSRRQQHQWPTEDVWFTFGSWSHWSWFGFRCSWPIKNPHHFFLEGEKWSCWGVLDVGWVFWGGLGFLGFWYVLWMIQGEVFPTCLQMILFGHDIFFFNVIATFKICYCFFNLFMRLTFLSHTEKNLCQPLGQEKKRVPIAFHLQFSGSPSYKYMDIYDIHVSVVSNYVEMSS